MSLVNDFISLSLLARRDHLHNLVPQLTSQEWRDLQATLCKRTFEFDIIGSLPVELVLIIFEHLNIATPFRCQRVCKKWREIFDDVGVIGSLLATFYTPEDPPFAGEEGLDIKSLQIFRAKRLFAFQTGTPSSTKDYAEYPPKATYATRAYDFHTDTLAWIDSARRRAVWSAGDARGAQVSCLNFRTGVKLVCRAVGHEMISCLALTSRIVGFVTYSGMCYACNLSTYAKRSLRLPSANVRVFGGRAGYLAIVQGSWSSGHTMALWNTTSNTTLSFHMPDCWERSPSAGNVHDITEGHGNFLGLLVAPNAESVVVFARIKFTNNSLQFARFSTSGDILSRGSIQLSTLHRDPRSFPVIPYNHNGLFTIRVEIDAFADGRSDTIILFDENNNIFLAEQGPFDSTSPLHQVDSQNINYVAVCLWKNFVIYKTETSPRLFVEPPSRSNNVKASKPLKRSDLFTVLGNDRFIVVFDSRTVPDSYRELESLRVYCFEPNLSLPERWNVQYPREMADYSRVVKGDTSFGESE